MHLGIAYLEVNYLTRSGEQVVFPERRVAGEFGVGAEAPVYLADADFGVSGGDFSIGGIRDQCRAGGGFIVGEAAAQLSSTGHRPAEVFGQPRLHTV